MNNIEEYERDVSHMVRHKSHSAMLVTFPFVGLLTLDWKEQLTKSMQPFTFRRKRRLK